MTIIAVGLACYMGSIKVIDVPVEPVLGFGNDA